MPATLSTPPPERLFRPGLGGYPPRECSTASRGHRIAQPARTDGIPRVTEQPTSHEGRQPTAARPHERTRRRGREAGPSAVPVAARAAAAGSGGHGAARGRPAAFRGGGDPADRARHRPGRDRARAVQGDRADLLRRDPRLSPRPAAGGRRAARRARSCCGCAAPTGCRLAGEDTDRGPSASAPRHRPADRPACRPPSCARCGPAARSPRCCAGYGRSSGTPPPPGPRCPSCWATDRTVPSGQRAILAPLRGRRRVIGAAVFLRRPGPARRSSPTTCWSPPSWPRTPRSASTRPCCTAVRRTSPTSCSAPCCPTRCPQPTGVRLASRYLPAAETARVGGDWYDAIPLPGSRVALVVGDVMGHSMTSAAIMGQLRTTAQTLAGLDLPPQEVLHHLDEQAQRLGTRPHGDLPVRRVRPGRRTGSPSPTPATRRPSCCTWAAGPRCCGCRRARRSASAASTSRPWSWTPRPGATLLLYTDGLVESRLRDVWTGIEQLRERLAATAQLTGPDHSPPLEALCDDVLDMLGPGDRDDDIALLAARFDGIAPSDVAYWFLEPEDAAPGRARRLARRALARWGLEELTRLGGAAGQRGGHQRGAVRGAAGDAAAAAYGRAALRGRRRLAAAAAAAPGPGHGRGRPRAVPGEPAGPAVGSDPAVAPARWSGSSCRPVRSLPHIWPREWRPRTPRQPRVPRRTSAVTAVPSADWPTELPSRPRPGRRCPGSTGGLWLGVTDGVLLGGPRRRLVGVLVGDLLGVCEGVVLRRLGGLCEGVWDGLCRRRRVTASTIALSSTSRSNFASASPSSAPSVYCCPDLGREATAVGAARR